MNALRTAALALTLALLPVAGLSAQQRSVLSKTVTVGNSEAAIALELTGGSDVSIGFRNGEIRIGGERVGSYVPGGSLESAWRSLLGVAIALDDVALATALVGWVPPSGLDSESTELAARIDRALESAFTAAPNAPAPAANAPAASVTVEAPEAEAPVASANVDAVELREIVLGDRLEDGISGGTLGSLFLRLDRLADIVDGLEDLEGDAENIRVLVDENVRIGAGEELRTPLFLIDGEIEIAGRLSTDLVVLDGEVVLLEGGVVDGRIQLADSEFLNRGGEMLGAVRTIRVDGERAAREFSRGLRDELRASADEADRGPWILAGPQRFLGNVGNAIGGVFGNLLTILVFGVGAWAVLYFASSNLDAVAESSRRAPGRGFTVGMAGTFLTLPAYVLGILGLAISIVGIPGLLLWIPFFPVAVALAMGLGYVAVARNLGAWLSRQRLPGMTWVRVTNSYTLMMGGLVMLFAPFILSNLLWIGGGWVDGLRTFLDVTGFMANAIAMLIGFGAVLTTRAGRKPEYWPDDLFGTPDPTESRRRRTAGRGFDPSGFESSTGWSDFGATDSAGTTASGTDAPTDGPNDATESAGTARKKTNETKNDVDGGVGDDA